MNPNAALYETDFYSWCLNTAALIRDGKWSDLDRAALAEEIEALAARDRREMHRRFKRLGDFFKRTSLVVPHGRADGLCASPSGGRLEGGPRRRSPPPRTIACGTTPHLASPRWGEVTCTAGGRRAGVETHGEPFPGNHLTHPFIEVAVPTQPTPTGHSWRSTIRNQRDELPGLFEQSPALGRQASEALHKSYGSARPDAAEQTRLPLATFPVMCPWTEAQVLDPDFWPDAPSDRG